MSTFTGLASRITEKDFSNEKYELEVYTEVKYPSDYQNYADKELLIKTIEIDLGTADS